MLKRIKNKILKTILLAIGLMIFLVVTPLTVFAQIDHNDKLEAIFTKIDQAQAERDWIEVDSLINQAKRYTKDKALQFNLLSNQAWAALQMGEVIQAQKRLASAKQLSSDVDLSDDQQAAFQDTINAIKLVHIENLPPLQTRVVLGGNAAFTHSQEESFAEENAAFDYINQQVAQRIKSYSKPNLPPETFAKPIPPKLQRGEFEKTQKFIIRVEAAKKAYLNRIKTLRVFEEKQISNYQKSTKHREKNIVEMQRLFTQMMMMNQVFHKVKLTNLNYDADKEQFFGTVSVSNTEREYFRYPIVLPYPIDEAREAKKHLLKSNPLLIYALSKGRLDLKNILLSEASSNNNAIHIAQLTEENNQPTAIATYEVPLVLFQSKIIATSLQSDAILADSVISISIDPEIKKIKRKIAKAQQDVRSRDKQRRMKQLQQELAELRNVQRGGYEDDLPSLLAQAKIIVPDPDKYALIVGIDEYDKALDVPYASRSAELFAVAAQKLLGVPADNIKLLVDKDATAGGIKVHLKEMVNRTNKNSTLYFFYAGHGIPAQSEKGEPYLLPYDISPQYVYLEKDMQLRNIWRQLSAKRQGKVVAFVDSCFSGNYDNRQLFEGVAPGLMRRIDPGLPTDKFTVFSAGTNTQFANQYAEKGHRLFSYFLIRGLLEGFTDAKALNTFVKTKTQQKSRLLGPAYEQTPQV